MGFEPKSSEQETEEEGKSGFVGICGYLRPFLFLLWGAGPGYTAETPV